MKIQTKLKAGSLTNNHNESIAGGLRVKSAVKAGGIDIGNHNETVASGLGVKSAVKAGGIDIANHNQTVDTARPEIEPAILNTIADTLRVRSGVKAGIMPCI